MVIPMRSSSAKPSVPSEIANEPFFTKQTRAYADCYRWWLTDEDRQRWLKASSPLLGTLRVFSAGIFVEARGHSWERAGLPEGVLKYCTEGKGYFRQDGRQWEVQPGDLLYASPGTHHRYWADDKNPWTVYWMHLSGNLLPDYERLLGLIERGPDRHIGVHNDIVADFTRLVIHHPHPHNETDWFGIQTNAADILGRIAALPDNIADIAAAYSPIQKAIAHMTAALDQPFDLFQFARESGYSSGHFVRQFRRVTGLAPRDWFIRQKMQRACTLLTLPNIQIKEVASRLGYADQLYFSRLFKRIKGIPPEAYRRKVVHEHGLDGHLKNRP